MLSLWDCNCMILGGCEENESHRVTSYKVWIDGYHKGIREVEICIFISTHLHPFMPVLLKSELGRSYLFTKFFSHLPVTQE